MTSTQIRSVAAMLIASVLVCACTPRSSPDPVAAIEVATGENVQIPEEFPKDIPLPEGLAVENVSALAAQGTYVVIGRVPGLLETVVPDLKRQIEEHGWTEVSPVQQEDMRDMKMMNFEKESKMLYVTLFREDNGTSVNVTTSPK